MWKISLHKQTWICQTNDDDHSAESAACSAIHVLLNPDQGSYRAMHLFLSVTFAPVEVSDQVTSFTLWINKPCPANDCVWIYLSLTTFLLGGDSCRMRSVWAVERIWSSHQVFTIWSVPNPFHLIFFSTSNASTRTITARSHCKNRTVLSSPVIGQIVIRLTAESLI